MKNLLILAAMAAGVSAQAGFWAWGLDNDTNEIGGGVALTIENPAKTNFSADTVAGNAATVLNFEQGDIFNPGPYLSLANPIGGNGSGARTNQYTLLLDLKVSAQDQYHSLLQTGSSHSSSGATDTGATDNDGDWFMYPTNSDARANGLGISGDYADAGNPLRVGMDEYQRVVLTIDLTAASDGYRSYVDGELQNIVQSPSGFGVDGRYSLGSMVALFADNDNELRSNWSVNNVALWDRALSDSEVMALGGATAEAVPEPATMAVLGLLALAGLKRKKK